MSPRPINKTLPVPMSSSSYGHGFLQINHSIQTQLPSLTTPRSQIQKPTSLNHRINTQNLPIHPSSRRKMLNLSLLTIIVSSCKPILAETELERYTDINEGFTLLRPTSWIKVEKAGATVLFEDPKKGGNNVGVVVTPVRLENLREFGDPEFVSSKLIQAEKRKESTKDAQVISFMERNGDGDGDVQVYEFEYKVDSTRGGPKRVFSAVFVASKKLYLLNIAHTDTPQQPIDDHTRSMLEQVLHSFAPYQHQPSKLV